MTASSVQAVEVSCCPNKIFATGTEVEDKLRGGAVVIDLGAGCYLFALLSGSKAGHTLPADRDFGRGRSEIYEAIETQLGKSARQILPMSWPRLVTYADIDDPARVALVDPDDLAATFGDGYVLEGNAVAVTDAPVTEGVVEEGVEVVGRIQ